MAEVATQGRWADPGEPGAVQLPDGRWFIPGGFRTLTLGGAEAGQGAQPETIPCDGWCDPARLPHEVDHRWACPASSAERLCWEFTGGPQAGEPRCGRVDLHEWSATTRAEVTCPDCRAVLAKEAAARLLDRRAAAARVADEVATAARRERERAAALERARAQAKATGKPAKASGGGVSVKVTPPAGPRPKPTPEVYADLGPCCVCDALPGVPCLTPKGVGKAKPHADRLRWGHLGDCPRCGAAPGQPCATPKGARCSKPHAGREGGPGKGPAAPPTGPEGEGSTDEPQGDEDEPGEPEAPMPEAKPGQAQTVCLSREQAKLAALWAHKERTRYAMDGARVYQAGPASVGIEATDGKGMIRVERRAAEGECLNGGKLVPLDALKALSKAKANQPRAELVLPPEGKLRAKLGDGSELAWSPVEGTYPPTDDVWPNFNAASVVEVGLHADLLDKLAKTARLLGGGVRLRFVGDAPKGEGWKAGVQFEARGGWETSRDGDALSVRGVVMPLDLGSGGV